MYQILLVCNAGMSTGIMRSKIEEAARNANTKMQVKAIGLDLLAGSLNQINLVLLGPQIRYAEAEVRSVVKDRIPVMVMDPSDFGMMRGDVVFEKMMKLIQK